VPAHWFYTAGGFFLICLAALLIALFSATANLHFSTSMYDRRIGNCPSYSCDSGMNRIAIVIAFYSTEVPALLEFLSGVEANSSAPAARDLFDFFLVLIDETQQNLEAMQTVNDSVVRSGLGRLFSTVTVLPPIVNLVDSHNILRHFLSQSSAFGRHCFLQYLSLQTRILRRDWLDGIATHSTNASSQNFWIKGGLDMSFHPFSYLETIEITQYSLYAAHCDCLIELINLAEEDHPTWPLPRSLTHLLRSPTNVKLAHMLSTRMLPTSISVSFKDSAIRVGDIRSRFPDSYWAEGSAII
jgi:hypothetical protein